MNGLGERIESSVGELIEVRHDLHRHPELGYCESRTSGVVQSTLARFGIEYRSGLAKGTGVLGFIPATQAGGRCIALRADMDALPIPEQTGKAYASTTPGIMHACGHDGHTTILLGAARALIETPERRNDVLLLFQPAEEGGAGGEQMCLDGALNGSVLGRKADVIYGLHGFPTGRLGHVSTRTGPLMAAASEFRATIAGKGGHAAYPHFGVDPILAGSHIVLALQTIASRNVSPLDSVVVTVGQFDAGFAHNVIPNAASLWGTLRTLREETDVLARRRIDEIIVRTASAFGAEATVEWLGAYPVTRNAPDATDRFRTVAASVLGRDKVHEEPEPSMGGEDFAFYGREVPACFFFLGLSPAGQESYPGLHTPTFDFNDDAIATGVRVMTELALAP